MEPETTILRGELVLPDRVLDDGVVVIEAGLIAFAGSADEVPQHWQANLPAPSNYKLLPGMVDIHNHGGGGVNFSDAASPADVKRAVAVHRAHGTTTLLASLVTADAATMLAQAELLGALADAGEIAGIHAEGPFLAQERCGAQNPDYLIPGDAQFVRDLAEAAGGHLRTMTLAPEVPGALAAAIELIEAGAVPSIGHTNATFDQVASLVKQCAPRLREQGKTLTATHLFNAMPPLLHREPGPVAALLAAARDGDVVVELVGDGVHLAPATVSTLFKLLGSDAIALVTDAMAATGMSDGVYALGPMVVQVAGGVARLDTPSGPGAIAGGTACLLDVVRASVAAGVSLVDAVKAAATTPVKALQLADVGALLPGYRADVLVVNHAFEPQQVLRGGVAVAARVESE